MTISAKSRLTRTTSDFFPALDYQPSVVRSFGIIAFNIRKNKIISDYTENKLQALTFAASLH